MPRTTTRPASEPPGAFRTWNQLLASLAVPVLIGLACWAVILMFAWLLWR
jgi:hypothetical protein